MLIPRFLAITGFSFLPLLSLSWAADQQTSTPREKSDSVLLDRQATEVHLDLGDGVGEKYAIEATPVLTSSGYLTLIPGEQFALRFKSQKDGLLTQPEIESDPAQSDDCIPVKFSYEGGRAILIVGNPYTHELSYSLASVQAGSDELKAHQANSIPSRQGNIEAFREKILMLVLKDFRLKISQSNP